MPEGVASAKYIVIKKVDYEAIKSILAMFGKVSYGTYLKVFGQLATESVDVTYDKYYDIGGGDYVGVYSGTTYLLIAGVPDASGNFVEEELQVIEFDTRHADPLMADVKIETEVTSTSIKAKITPDENVKFYRAVIMPRSDFEF